MGLCRAILLLALLLVPTGWAGSDLRAAAIRAADTFASYNGGFPGSLIAARPADINGDGLTDLVLVSGRSAGKQRFETVTRGNAIFAELVAYQVKEKKAAALIQQPGGRFAADEEPLPFDDRYLAFDLADVDEDGLLDLLLLDDHGLEVRYRQGGSWLPDGLRLVEGRSTFSGSRQFFGGLRLLHDLDADGRSDLVLPRYEKAVVCFAPFLDGVGGKTAGPVLTLDGGIYNHRYGERRMITKFPMPIVEDCNGDGLSDIRFLLSDSVSVYLQRQGRAFAGTPREVVFPEPGEGEERTGRHFGDIDGDGIADLLLFHALEGDNDTFREGKNPKTFVELFPGDKDLSYPDTPVSRSLIRGAVAAGDEGSELFPSFIDLNGDGLLDILGISFDVGMFQLLKLATVQKLTVEIIFKNYLQNPSHGFHGRAVHEVTEKFSINLRDLEMPEFPFFSGDFNGDGIRDYIRFNDGSSLGVHFSAGDGTYSKKPDLKIRLPREARNPDLLLISELNGDPRSDVVVFKAGEDTEECFQVVIYTSRGE